MLQKNNNTGLKRTTSATSGQCIPVKKVVFSIRRVILWSISFMLIGFIVAYAFRISSVTAIIDMLFHPVSVILKVKYDQFTVAFSREVPGATKELFREKLAPIAFEGRARFTFIDNTETATVVVSYSAIKGENTTVFSSSYIVPVGHMYWLRDGIAKSALVTETLYVAEGKKALYEKVLEAALGKKPALTEVKDLEDTLKTDEKTIGLIDFFELSGTYKLLSLDSHYLLDKDKEGGIPYYLMLRSTSVQANNVIGVCLGDVIAPAVDENEFFSLTMTGVTAISRGLMLKTNASGNPGYAAEAIGSFLKRADLTHTSNEVSFVDDCKPANGTVFCAVNSHIKVLEDCGIDIVELTGNHNNDYGAKWNASTIKEYTDRKWDYFGGGLNTRDAAKILYKEVKGTKLAFIGYNYYDTAIVKNSGALATASRAGANSWSTAKVKNDMAEAKMNADVVIVTFQYQECAAYPDNTSVAYAPCYKPIGNQKTDFRYAIDQGADIVIGTQAHQPQTYEIYNGKPVFYGLGNLFFDQKNWIGTRQGLVLTHYFYKGKYFVTKITTTLYDNDLITYVTTGDKRTTLLNALKNAR